EEVGACGTAVVISPIGEVNGLDSGKVYKFCCDGKPGPISKKLYETLVGIQYGDIDDKHGWITVID
ncbi:MAG TPA: branched chain amino acid aminotransferase, partial [Tenuifilaceae bacterium]|nr:branched chain amino acid aminotransferase [Tenuifilaceae bacterium]